MDLASTFRSGRRGQVMFARQHLGMEAEVFRGAAFVSQASLPELPKMSDQVSALQEALASLADTGADTSSSTAIAIINRALEQVGRTGRGKNPLIARVTHELSLAQAALGAAREAHQQAEESLAEAVRIQEELVGGDSGDPLLRFLYQEKLPRLRQGRMEYANAMKEEARTAREVSVAEAELLASDFPQAEWPRIREQMAGLDEERLASLRSWEEEIHSLEHQELQMATSSQFAVTVHPSRPGRPWWVVAVSLIAAGLAFYFNLKNPTLGGLAAAGCLAVGLGIFLFWSRRLESDWRKRSSAAQAARAQRAAMEARTETLKNQLSAELARYAVRGLGELETRARRFIQWSAEHEDYTRCLAAREQARRERGRMETQLRELTSGLNIAVIDLKFLADLEQRVEKREQEHREHRRELELRRAELRAVVNKTLEGHRPLAEFDEEVAALSLRLSTLEHFRSALELAMLTIENKTSEAHRDFAPGLKLALEEVMGRITAGRYREAFLDPGTFRLGLKDPQSGEQAWEAALSRGTRDQLYLALRLEMCRLLSTAGETVPIFLDDPLVHCDPQRKRALVELLLEQSLNHQVWMVATDPTLAALVENSGKDYRIHHLALP